MPAAVFVVIHVAPSATSALASILDRAGPLPASQAVDGEAIELSRIYVASPNRHLLIKEGSVAVAVGPRENRHRPAIDTLFRTAARVYGARVIGVVLSGCGDDGVAGLRAIHDRGGVTIVQDPAEASFSDLPRNALAFATVDHTAPVADIAPLVARIVETPARSTEPPTATLKKEARLAEADLATIEDERKVGVPSAFSCPDCGGVLWEVEGGDSLRFRCRVGHSYSADALSDEQDDRLERGLWAALRALEENASLARQLATRSLKHGRAVLHERFKERADEAQANADAVRQMILQFGSPRHAQVTDN